MRSLLIATSGGHLSELLDLRNQIVDLGEQSWITNDHPQTRRALSSESVQFVPMIESRDLAGVIASIPNAMRRLRSGKVDQVVTTGSALAISYLAVAAMRRIPAHYIESATRVKSPSVTGKIAACTPGVTTWWQHDHAPRGWKTVEGPYSQFSRAAACRPCNIVRVVVTVGTTDYCFRRLIEQLVRIMPPQVEVFWQVGESDTSGLGIDAHSVVEREELDRRIRAADVVVSHAGAGSLLQCLQAGKIPVYVPRLYSFGEQVDDHQVELAEWAHRKELAVTVEADRVQWSDLVQAASCRALVSDPSPIDLSTT